MRRIRYYGPGINKNGRKKRRHHLYIFSQEDLNNDDVISMVDTIPTYKRTKSDLESIQTKASMEETVENAGGNDAGHAVISFG